MPLLLGSLANAGGTAIGWPRASSRAAVVEPHDAMHALDPEPDRAAVLGDRFGVVPPRAASGLPSAPSTGAISASAIPAGRVPS
jgi:hypothetical protein